MKILRQFFISLTIISMVICTNINITSAETNQEDEIENIFPNSISFSDVSPNYKHYNDIINVAQAGLMSGYEDGTFKPSGKISRAEFATIICRLVGVDAVARNINKSIYTDVPSSHWAVGRIAKAAELGIINGYGDGNFGPSDDVLYEQAIKMLVCAEYPDNNAESIGGYPKGYINFAEDKNLLSGIAYKEKVAATREDIAMLLNNVLNQKDDAFVSAANDELSIMIE